MNPESTAVSDKIEAKRLAIKLGIPVVPGSEGGIESDEEAAQIAAALPFCSRLEQLALQNNNITSSGASAVVQAACTCSGLQGLDFTGNPIDAATQLSMVQQWQAAGTAATSRPPRSRV